MVRRLPSFVVVVALWASLLVSAMVVAPSPAGAADADSATNNSGTSNSGTTDSGDFERIAALEELTSQHADVFRLYHAFFLRKPDPRGALRWVAAVDRCLPLAEVAERFGRGAEFTGRYGSLDDAEFVARIYRNVLGRAGEAAGLAHWTRQVTEGRLSRGEMVLAVSGGPEFRALHRYPSDGVPARVCVGGVGAPGGGLRPVPAGTVLAEAGGVTVHAPAGQIEHVGMHQSSHPGSVGMAVSGDVPFPVTVMASRNRGTVRTGAADVVVEADAVIGSPVAGTVKRAGTYILYCRYRDGFVVIAPDQRPELELKVFHMRTVSVSPGDRVSIGDPIGADATPFPFRSQVDELTAEPSRPHVHLELVDPSVPRKPSSGSC